MACLNCGAPLTGPFCAACGQRDVAPYPSLRELVVDGFQELSGWDGKVAATVRALVRNPGVLTLEFLTGRRTRYVSPMRLYLLASLVYFLVAAAAPDVQVQSGKTLHLGLHVGVTTTGEKPASPSAGGAAPSSEATRRPEALSEADKRAALQQIGQAPALIRPVLRRAIEDPQGFRRGIFDTMPRMFFALLPVLAVIIAMFYRGRKYPEHLYFAIHLQTFIFLVLAATEALKFTKLPALVVGAAFAGLLWISIYATLAFRRVYGGSLIRTITKELAILALYGATSIVAFIGLLYWVGRG